MPRSKWRKWLLYSLLVVIAASWPLTGFASATDLKLGSALNGNLQIDPGTIQIDPGKIQIDPSKIQTKPDETKTFNLRDAIISDSKELMFKGPQLFIDFQLISKKASLRWATDIGVAISAPPAVGPDGTIYIGGHNKGLYAISPQGVKKWTLYLGGVAYAAPAVGSDGTIYVNTYDDQKLVAVSPNGYKKWEFKKEGSALETAYPAIFASPVIGADGTIYAGGFNDRKLYAISPAGKKKWSFSTIGYVGTPEIGGDGTIYFASNHYFIEDYYEYPSQKEPLKTKYAVGKVYAVSPNGTKKWEGQHNNDKNNVIYENPAVGFTNFKIKNGYLESYETRSVNSIQGPDGITYYQPGSGLDPNVMALYPARQIKWKFSAQTNSNDMPRQRCSVPEDYESQYSTYSTPHNSYGWWEGRHPNLGIVRHCPPALASDGTVYVVIRQSLYAIGTVAVSSVDVNKNELELEAGKSEDLIAIVIPINATNRKVAWSSDNIRAAVVDNTGKVTGVAPGKAKITVYTEEGGYYATTVVTVKAGTPGDTVTLNKNAITLEEGESEALKATTTGNNAADQQLTWVSTNSNIAAVDNAGKVTAIAPGNAFIVAISGAGGTATASVTVIPSSKPPAD